MTATQGVRGTAALSKGISVIRAVANEGPASSFSRIQAATRLPRGTLHRLLRALTAEGLIRYDGDGKTYHLGLAFLTLTYQVLDELDIRDVARSELVRLRDCTGEAVHLAVHDDLRAIYIEVVESGRAVGPIARIGSSSELHCSAVGKAIAAFLPPEQLRDVLHRLPMTKSTPKTISSRSALKSHLETVRELGHALNEEEESIGIHGVAAPVFNRFGTVMASICLTIPSYRFDPSGLDGYASAVMNAGRAVSERMGCRIAGSFDSVSVNSRPQAPRTPAGVGPRS